MSRWTVDRVGTSDAVRELSSLVQRITAWRTQHGGSPREHDLPSLLSPHRSLQCLATFGQGPEGESVLHRCEICGTYWTIHRWAAFNEVNIEQAAVVRRW
jgi:hypothetical protein